MIDVPTVYVLNRKQDTDRLEGLMEVYPECLPTPTIYTAKTGDDVDVPDWWKSNANSWAATQNFIDILKLGHSAPFMLCEDDCAFAPDFGEKLNAFLPHVPDDWDILYLGGRNDDCMFASPLKVNDYVLKCRNTGGTFCIVINNKSVGYLWSYMEAVNWPCSHAHDEMLALGQWSENLIAYSPLAFIAGQRAGVPSTIHPGIEFKTTEFFNHFTYIDPDHHCVLQAGTLYSDDNTREA